MAALYHLYVDHKEKLLINDDLSLIHHIYIQCYCLDVVFNNAGGWLTLRQVNIHNMAISCWKGFLMKPILIWPLFAGQFFIYENHTIGDNQMCSQ